MDNVDLSCAVLLTSGTELPLLFHQLLTVVRALVLCALLVVCPKQVGL